MTDPAMPPPPPTPAPAASQMGNMFARFSQAELLIGGGALLIALADIIFGWVTRDFSIGQLPWAVATTALFAIVALRFAGLSLPIAHEAILVMAGLVIGLVGIRDLVLDLRDLSGSSTTFLIGSVIYYVGVALMFVGAWLVWRRRTA